MVLLHRGDGEKHGLKTNFNMMPKTKKELELIVNPPIPVELLDKISVLKIISF